MAEKATVDVLTILENQGISDAAETYDSSSDEETHQESQEEHSVPKRRSKLEEHSGSDLDSSPVSGRTLSWKGRSKSPRSREKYKDLSTRRRNAFSSVGSSSPRHHLGKSCRQIRRRETRLVLQTHPPFSHSLHIYYIYMCVCTILGSVTYSDKHLCVCRQPELMTKI